ncbi:TnpA family transposase [Nonomuraea angiospora]|uniref:TnpA family transposase n=2 Tax=Nonomuraea angiospora TaxID=46172 RepID=A0ABR9LPU8_9ACTN|nr:TnpA family transposase [Nonomuraea angiospora]
MVGKWSAASWQNTLAAALKEWGRMRRAIHAARYMSDPVYRRKISRQLNKGESLHALLAELIERAVSSLSPWRGSGWGWGGVGLTSVG